MRRMSKVFSNSSRQWMICSIGSDLLDLSCHVPLLTIWQLIKDIKAWRTGWEDVLKFQYDASEAFANLYKPIDPTSDPEQHHQPVETPAKYMQKCLGIQKEYDAEKTDLAQETKISQKAMTALYTLLEASILKERSTTDSSSGEANEAICESLL